ncbi:hypothetical protein ZWY2020_044350 [Hordeum vulgare]|nr:hypothetical protein ZWY2020_044350 [Hordeum vulgare]
MFLAAVPRARDSQRPTRHAHGRRHPMIHPPHPETGAPVYHARLAALTDHRRRRASSLHPQQRRRRRRRRTSFSLLQTHTVQANEEEEEEAIGG